MTSDQNDSKPCSKHLQKLIGLVTKEVASSPYTFDGYDWASRPRHWYCAQLGISQRTFSSLVTKEPLDARVILIDGKKATLLRVKKPDDPMTVTHCQRILRKIWQTEIGPFNERKAEKDASFAEQYEHNVKYYCKQIDFVLKHKPSDKSKLAELQKELEQTKRLRDHHLKRSEKAAKDAKKVPKLSKRGYGCLRGLVEAWGVNNAPEFFLNAIRNWDEFMAAAGVRIAELDAKGEQVFKRYFEFPTITFMLRFKEVAFEVKVTHVQENMHAVISKHVDPNLPLLEKLKQEFLLKKSIMDALKPVVFPPNAG